MGYLPWTVLISFVAGFAACAAFVRLRAVLAPWFLHRRTRALVPCAGQVWIGKSRDAFTVHRELPDGRWLIHSFRGQIRSLNREAWQKLVDDEKLALVANFREAA